MAKSAPTFEEVDKSKLRNLAEGADIHAAWEAICAFLVQPRMEKIASLWLPFMEELLRRWPDEARTWPDAFLNKKSAPAATALVRHFYFGGRSESAHGKSLAHLALLGEETMPKLTRLTIGVHALDTPQRRITNADRLSEDEARMLIARMSMNSMRDVCIKGTGLPKLLWEALGGAVWTLETLRIEGVAKDADMARLMNAPGVRFDELILGDILGWVEFGEASVDALLKRHAHAVKALMLTEAVVDEAAFAAMCDASWPMLARLAFERQRFAVGSMLPRWFSNAPGLVDLDFSIQTMPRRFWRAGVSVTTQPDTLHGVLNMLQQHPLPRLASLALNIPFEGQLADALRAVFGHASHPQDGLQHLTLVGREADDEVARLIRHLQLRTLRVLDAPLSFWKAMEGADFTQLRCLAAGFSSDQVPDDELVVPFVMMKANAPALEVLHLEYTIVTDAVLDVIESAPYFPQLRSLHEGSTPSFKWNEAVKARFNAMCESARVRQLGRAD